MGEWICEEVPGVSIDGKVLSTFLHKTQELVRCKDCIYAESFFESYRCYFDEENESGCKRSHDADFFCAYGEVGK